MIANAWLAVSTAVDVFAEMQGIGPLRSVMRALDRVVALNLSLVMAHQVDAAYWKEWEMFGLPGGIQLFIGFNLVAFLILLRFFSFVLLRQRKGLRASFLIAALSGIVFPIHAVFAAFGFPQFHLPVSIAVILGCFVVSLWQAVLTWRARKEFGVSS